MRISGGEFRGRELGVPKTGDIRPTQDRVREALFSMLMGDTPGCRFLDLFAGTGCVGLEAVSRGAAHATLVERDARHAAVARRNAQLLLGDASHAGAAVSVVVSDAYRFIEGYSGEPFDMAFADPHYATGEERGYAAVLAALSGRNAVREGGLFAAEMTSSQKADEVAGWELVRDRRYGKTRLCIWCRRPAADGSGSGSKKG